MGPIYLDNAATTQVCPEAAALCMELMVSGYGNPSSTHALGRAAKKALDTAREQVAKALACKPGEVFFTAGGSESDNWAIRMGAHKMRHRGNHILSSLTEHDAVRRSLDALEEQGYSVTRLAPAPSGEIPTEAVLEALRSDTILVSLMLVNNETGSVTDIAAIAAGLRQAGSSALLHTDAVQGFLKVPCRPGELGVDLMSISSHKIHGPKGAGALYIRQGLQLPPLILGGGQEAERRAGTEALPAIAGFGLAASLGAADFPASVTRMAELRRQIIETLAAALPELQVNGGGAPHLLNLSLPGHRSEVLLNWLDAQGVCVARSSACKKGRRSHVLEAMGLPATVIDGSIRVSLSRYTTAEEAKAFCQLLIQGAGSLRRSVR